MAKRIYHLDLMFDVDQVTKALHYHIDGPKGTPFQREGRLAGTFHFNAGDEIFVTVKATAQKKDKAQFTVTDLTLASIPTLSASSSPKNFLSLFDQHRASIRVADWGIPERGEDDDDVRTEITVKALHPLVVCAPNGQWEISGYLSVLIEKRGQDGAPQQIPRLFYFDPEGSTGSGGDIEE